MEQGGSLSDSKKIGELNGKWSVLFRAMLAISVLMVPFGVTWMTWVTITVQRHAFDIQMGLSDRFTGTMQIEAGAQLEEKNASWKGLAPKEVRDIQGRSRPYIVK